MNSVKVNPNVRCAQSVDGALLLDLDRGRYFSLNTVGSQIWEELEKETPVEQIVRQVAGRFHVEADVVRRDAGVLIQALAKTGLVNVC